MSTTEPSFSSVSCQPKASRLASALDGRCRRRRRSIRLAIVLATPMSMIRSPKETTWSATAIGMVSPSQPRRVSSSAMARAPETTTRSRSPVSTSPASTSASARTGVAPLRTMGTRLTMMPTPMTAIPTIIRLRMVKISAATSPANAHQPGCGRSNWSVANPMPTARASSGSEAIRTPRIERSRPRRMRPAAKPMMTARTRGAKVTGNPPSRARRPRESVGQAPEVRADPRPAQMPDPRAVPISASPSARST